MGDHEQQLQKKYGQLWDTTQLQTDFEVISFLAPRVKVRRKKDGQLGTMEFTHRPRFYFNFIAVN